MRIQRRIVWLAAVGFLAAISVTDVAWAQFQQYRPPSVQPFQNILSRPTVSPYLNLLQPQFNGVPNYQTLVRPQIEARRAEQANAMAIQQLQSQVASPGNFNRSTGGSVQVRGTGHVSGFQNHMHFFPGPNQASYQQAWQSRRAQ